MIERIPPMPDRQVAEDGRLLVKGWERLKSQFLPVPFREQGWPDARAAACACCCLTSSMPCNLRAPGM